MGKSNVAVKLWLSDKERFADFFNVVVFGGRQVIQSDDLEMIEGESDMIVTDKAGKEKVIQRYRDIVMRWKEGIEFAILAIENQDEVHYAMPVRNMLYDALTYTEQIRQLWKKYQKSEDKSKLSSGEFLSRFRKDDKLQPVVTLVFYYGTEAWDGSIDIYDMLGSDKNQDEMKMLKKYVPNYRINLVDVLRIKDIKEFVTDLQLIFGMLQYRNQKNALVQYVNRHKDYFGRLDQDTFHAISAFLNSGSQLEHMITIKSREEGVNMCKALEDLYEEGVGKGIEQGAKAKEIELILKKAAKGVSVEEIADFMELPVDKVSEIISTQAEQEGAGQ